MEQEVMQAIRAELESNIDAKYREFHSSLVPGQNCRILGVRIPVSRRIAKATARDHYEVYTEQFNPEVYEELLIRGMMIGYGKLTRKNGRRLGSIDLLYSFSGKNTETAERKQSR